MPKKRAKTAINHSHSTESQRELPIRIVLPPMKPSTHPFFVFWLGFLTGALVLSLCLGYLLLQTQALEKIVNESIAL